MNIRKSSKITLQLIRTDLGRFSQIKEHVYISTHDYTVKVENKVLVLGNIFKIILWLARYVNYESCRKQFSYDTSKKDSIMFQVFPQKEIFPGLPGS